MLFRSAGTRNRTADLLITNQLLYQLSYPGVPILQAGASLSGRPLQASRNHVLLFDVGQFAGVPLLHSHLHATANLDAL